jgi:cholesterol transport system auxiliary component
MRKAVVASLGLCVLLAFAGCLGKGRPQPVYMRLKLTEAVNCDQSEEASSRDRFVVAVKELTCLPGLERQSVLMADGPVLQPSTSWYWEAPPAEIMGQALANGLGCQAEYNVVYPYRPMVRRDAVLSGHVTSFEVIEGEDRFAMALRLDLWGEEGRRLEASRIFRAATDVERMKPQGVAEAADRALDVMLEDILQWLKSRRSGAGTG